MKLDEKGFDELQTRIRGKIFRDSFALLSFLLLFDGFLKEQGILLATPLACNGLIILISILYCDIRLIFNNAYISNEKNWTHNEKLVYLIAICILIFYTINYNRLFTKDNLLSNQVIFFATFLLYIIRSLLLYIKEKMDLKK